MDNAGRQEGIAFEEKIERDVDGPLRNGDNEATTRINPGCVVCGPKNPWGLHLDFEAGGGVSVACWRTTTGLESFRGTIHGGVICAVLDEAMSRAIVSAGYSALTAELRVRFRQKVVPGEELSIRGWVAGVWKRKIEAESSLVSADGVEKAHARATFLTTRSG
jgi:acyl-coenzyme A thioesterase PaaI-like protein